MQDLIDLIEPFTDVAIVNAMNLALGAFGLRNLAAASEAAKGQLKKLITGEVRADGTVVLSLDVLAADRVGPLYTFFSCAWSTEHVRQSTLAFLKDAPALEGVKFDVRLVVR